MRQLLLAILLALGPWTAPAFAQQRPADAILILDASGSMWGQVEGQTKIAAARVAVDRILASWRPADRLGLMAYGHRAKGDCRDIEMIAPVGALDAEAFRRAVRGLNPRGRTPIAAALRQAAATLKSTEERATVILVSDGIETCDPDPCAVAAELKKAGVGFTAHVVGFDITDPLARTQLQCIAQTTGGIYLDAKNAAGLEGAMARVAQAAQGQKVASEAPPRTAKPVDPLAGRNLRATARLTENSDPITDPKLNWILFKPNAEGAAGEHVQTEYGARLAVAAPAGEHILRVEYGAVQRDFPVTLDAKKPTTLDLVLEAGFVTAEGVVPNGSLGKEGIVWVMTDLNGQHVATSYDPVPVFVVAAGEYDLNLTKGYATAGKRVSVAAGDSVNLPFDLPFGRLGVEAIYAAAGPKVAQGLTVEVHTPAKELAERGEFVATHYDPLSVFDLAAGDYDVTVGAGLAKRRIKVTVASGKTERMTVDLAAGVVALTVPDASQTEIVEARKSIEGTRALLGTFHDGAVQTVLAAGDYVAVRSKDGAVAGETPFTVKAGERLELAVK